MNKPTILIVDDDEDVRTQLSWALNADYEVVVAQDRPAAMELARLHKPAVVALDLALPPLPTDPREGLQTLSELLQMDPLAKVVVITGRDEDENGRAAIAVGAYGFFCKPVNIKELKVVFARAILVQNLERDRRRETEGARFDSFEGIIGASPEIRRVFSTIDKISASDVSALIVGESGTGKELVARAIHQRSARRQGPFVAINCAAIPETLLESELFGHEKGAFTGAHQRRQGRIELARGGTLFLDEMGELSPAIQVKLLRFLQEHEIERVGGREVISVDARVVAATNVDLAKAMAGGRFREDLYYRLAVVVIQIPPLRERQGDIELLAKAFLQKQAAVQNQPLVFTPKASFALQAHRWPGNVRELENRIQRGAIMAEGGRITPKDLGLASHSGQQGHGLDKAREALDRRMVQEAIARNKGNLTRAAHELDISRPTLYELLERHGITRR